MGAMNSSKHNATAATISEYLLLAGEQAGEVTILAPDTMLCPLDGHRTAWGLDEFLTCTSCHELLTVAETVVRADESTWAAYLTTGTTETDPEDAPLARLAA